MLFKAGAVVIPHMTPLQSELFDVLKPLVTEQSIPKLEEFCATRPANEAVIIIQTFAVERRQRSAFARMWKRKTRQ